MAPKLQTFFLSPKKHEDAKEDKTHIEKLQDL